MRVKKELLLPLVNYLKQHEKFEEETSIQCGTQYVVSGVVIDTHFSTKKKETFSLVVKNETADPEFVEVFNKYMAVIAEPVDPNTPEED